MKRKDDRECFGSIAAVSGPKVMIKDIKKAFVMFDKVYLFEVPDDYGEFPDTSGYSREDFASIETVMEDPALLPYMKKCLDAVMDFNDQRIKVLDKLGYQDIEGILCCPKFGGKVFAALGFVKAQKIYRIVKPGFTEDVLTNIIQNNQPSPTKAIYSEKAMPNRHERRKVAKLRDRN